MAAHFVFVDGTERIWHIGTKPFSSAESIKNIDYVQIDGDEAELVYDIGMCLSGYRVHKLTHNESALYCMAIQLLYGASQKEEAIIIIPS